MSKRVIIMVLVLASAIFLHYYNNHRIIQLAKEYTEMENKLDTLTQQNKQLISANNQLKSRKRIQHLAAVELGMFFPTSTDHMHLIGEDVTSTRFRLIDCIIPSVEALTH